MKTLGKIAIVAGATAVPFVGYGWRHLPVLPFRAVTSSPTSSLHEQPMKKEEKPAIAAVLRRYGERYAETEDTIWITPGLFFDRDLRWNYTSKSKTPIQLPEPTSGLAPGRGSS